MIPPKVDVEIYQGDTFEIFIRARLTNSDGTPGAYVDLTGYTATSQIRDDADVLKATFACSLSDQGTTPGGILARLTPAITAALTPSNKIGSYDIQVTDGTDVYTFIRGDVQVTKERTHP